MTPEQIREEATLRTAEALWVKDGSHGGVPNWFLLLPEDQDPYLVKAGAVVDALEGILPTGGIRYAVAHPVTGTSDPRFVGYTLEESKRFATEFDTHVIQQHLTEWTTHE